MKNRLCLILLLNIGLAFGDATWDGDGIECLAEEKWDKNMTACSYDKNYTTLDLTINENAENVSLGYIRCANCSSDSDVAIGRYLVGNKAFLEAELKNDEGKWCVIMKKPQDFENPLQQNYKFEIHVGEELPKYIKITINDVDDNAPIVRVDQKTCIIMENKIGLSNCTYQIHDPDDVSDVLKTNIQFVHTEMDYVNELFEVKLSATDDSHNALGIMNVLSALDFENISMYIMNMNAKDTGGNVGSDFVTIEVADDNDRPPVWDHIFATETFPEEEIKDFNVSAFDGDLKINAEINYKFSDACHENISIDEMTGEIHINTIDRDVLENDFITCVVIAYEKETPEMQVNATITFLILDINDNDPIITPSDIYLEFPETKYQTFEQIVSINDIDLGAHATYTVELLDKGVGNYGRNKAFQVIPSSAYKLWNFSLTIIDPKSLDYENEDWRQFTMQILATDPDRKYESNIHIQLTNRNDEVPEFTEKIYQVQIPENATANTEITTITATDNDCNDSVVYSLTGDYLRDSFQIDKYSGTIRTKVDNVFNYEKQTQVLIQVQAEDTLQVNDEPTHIVYAQVQVTVLDVNDEPPRLSLPNQKLVVPENLLFDKCVTNEILAADPDGDAELLFTINWFNSSATKQGSPVDLNDFQFVFKIETKFQDESKKGYAFAELRVNQSEKLDYEIFDVLYLEIIVTDVNQTSDNTDFATLPVTIDDVNDHEPIFDQSTIKVDKIVIEKSSINTLIATILATDEDGPKFSNITYSLTPTSDTPDGLVVIGEINGQLRVASNNIDADVPRWNLTYNVTASDGTYSTMEPIVIYIEDTNDKSPIFVDNGPKTILVDEGTTSLNLSQVKCKDDDRNEQFSMVNYYLNPMGSSSLMYLFKINNVTGQVYVDVETSGHVDLDRDKGPTYYDIYVTCKDNVGYPGIHHSTDAHAFNVSLKDINNKVPELPDIIILDISENEEPGKVIATIRANDLDELGTENTHITYKIINITKDDVKTIEDIFIIETVQTDEYYDGILKTSGSLRGYYGTVEVIIYAQDFGDPPLNNSKSYSVNIIPYNYKKPVFLSPQEDKIILEKEQYIRKPLVKVDGKPLDEFRATDQQGGKFSMKFEVMNKDGDGAIFDFIRQSINKAELVLTSEPDTNKIYSLKIRTFHDVSAGDVDWFVEKDFHIYFVDPHDNPIFDDAEITVNFLENNDTDCKPFPKAIDPKCINFVNCYPIYYHILPKIDAFNITIENSVKPAICVIEKLDREEIELYYLEVVASNLETPPASTGNFRPLNLTINVLDVNDNPPVFNRSLFSGSMTSNDPTSRSIVELEATDLDSSDQGKLVYSIDYDTVNISDSSLEAYKQTPFVIQENKIQSNFKPQADTKGFFIFRVRVSDSIGGEDHEDLAYVKIYIISKEDRITFNFKNVVSKVEEEKEFIEQVFSAMLVYKCAIDSIDKASVKSGELLDDQTEVLTHFIDEYKHEPVPEQVILHNTSDTEMVLKLATQFRARGLDFYDIQGGTIVPAESREGTLRMLLIIISVVLGTLCVVVSIAFVIRTRNWNKRLTALTTNVFGSTKSDLNRIGTNVPGTNKHAIEANPVWNEDLNKMNEFDTISENSDGSDLIGIEDNPEFDRRASINPVVQEQARRKSLNPMASSTILPNDVTNVGPPPP